MRVLDIQSKMRSVGVIRLGEQGETNKPGKRLSTFRLTSNDKRTLEAVARRYGGEVRPWPNGSQQWQITTRASEIPIEVGNIPVMTAYEHWAQVGGTGSKQCIRRCDGCTIREGIERGNPCQCPADPKERAEAAKRKGSRVCSLVTRMFVRLPEVPDIGLWKVSTGSFFAAQEVPAIMDGIEALAQMGAHIRARLAIDIRTGGGKKFPVPVVRMDQTNDELRELAVSHFERMKALEGADKMAQVAFKLGIPMSVINGDQKELPATTQAAQALPVHTAEEARQVLEGWDE